MSLITAISIAYDSFNLKPEQISKYIVDKFYNIGTSKEGKLRVKKGVDTLVEQLKKLSNDMIEVPSIEVIPHYVKDLILLVRFMLSNAPYVQSYLLLDHNVQKTSLKGKPTRFNQFATSKVQFEKIKEMNSILFKILYNGKPISNTFNSFV